MEIPKKQWDLSKLSPQLRRALAPNKSKASTNRIRGGVGGSSGSTLVFEMSKEHFQHWVCDDVMKNPAGGSATVVTLSTVVYPLPLLARNLEYSGHPIFLAAAAAGGGESVPSSGSGGGREGTRLQPAGVSEVVMGQRGVEALETILTRIILRPTRELRERAMELAGRVRERAEEWGRRPDRKGVAGVPPPPVRVVGIHARTYFMKAVSGGTVSKHVQILPLLVSSLAGKRQVCAKVSCLFA